MVKSSTKRYELAMSDLKVAISTHPSSSLSDSMRPPLLTQELDPGTIRMPETCSTCATSTGSLPRPFILYTWDFFVLSATPEVWEIDQQYPEMQQPQNSG